uniref:Uncharacterized protein n=1 Tax=Utricularia reniformis TaxID=192314 RepID=A0A1Y0B1W8_9LAMI|nr:hypothetical protein AEK19_MT1234 [Utricularia reniformis]ART31446.1 hypothetical protein AEK19_MT1234 [Utricularia reniformis]
MPQARALSYLTPTMLINGKPQPLSFKSKWISILFSLYRYQERLNTGVCGIRMDGLKE